MIPTFFIAAMLAIHVDDNSHSRISENKLMRTDFVLATVGQAVRDVQAVSPPKTVTVETSPGQTTSNTQIPVYYFRSREMRFPIKYNTNPRRSLLILIAREGESVWSQKVAVPSDQEEYTYVAKEDGVYLFALVDEDHESQHKQVDITRVPPHMKLIVDTLPPCVWLTRTERQGEAVTIRWVVEEKYPDESRTQVHFRPVGSEDLRWREVSLPKESKSGVLFYAKTTDAITVRVQVFDQAGNKTEVFCAVRGDDGNVPSSTSQSPAGTSTILPTGGVTLPTNSLFKVDELDNELTRLEIELIQKELKKLANESELSLSAEEKIDRLRVRLSALRARLVPSATLSSNPGSCPEGAKSSNESRIVPAALPLPNSSPSSLPSSPANAQFPLNPSIISPSAPTIPVPSLPVAPPPRAQKSE